MERICFVIMPFSGTDSCSKKQWTNIYTNLFKKTIEEAGMGYECRRSSATRGSIIKSIIKDLDSSYIVLADLTDQNPNVFYELGIRHALQPRTILVAQDRKYIPFDLRGYANHIYDWQSTAGRKKFRRKIIEILKDIDKDSERSDNPVSDFFFFFSFPTEGAEIESKRSEMNIPIVGPGASKLNISDIVRKMAEENHDERK